MKFPGYRLAPDESGFSARFIGRSSVARRFIVGSRYGSERIREICAQRGIDWDRLSEDELRQEAV